MNKYNKLKSRKVIGGILMIILATIVAMYSEMDVMLFTSWSNFVLIIYATYVIGNVGDKFVNKRLDDGHSTK